MKEFGNLICKHKILVLIITILLIIPSIIGYIKTDINYDILVYLPSDIETLKGEEILTDDFKIDYVLLESFCNSILTNKKDIAEENLNKVLQNISFMDSTESFYHGYLLGLFSQFLNNNFIVLSNREAGVGRFDLMIESKNKKVGIIIELKITKDDMEASANEALNQIEKKEYYQVLVSDKVETIYKYAIVFKGKKCIVR